MASTLVLVLRLVFQFCTRFKGLERLRKERSEKEIKGCLSSCLSSFSNCFFNEDFRGFVFFHKMQTPWKNLEAEQFNCPAFRF